MRKNKINELELIKCIIVTKSELEIANKNFESAEKELIDYYSYQIKANKAKLDYLIRKVKEKGISIDIINNLKIDTQMKEAMYS